MGPRLCSVEQVFSSCVSGGRWSKLKVAAEEKGREARVRRMPASNTQGYINGGANVAARAAQLAADPAQLDKAAKRMGSRWRCSGGVAQRAAAVLVTESAVVAEF